MKAGALELDDQASRGSSSTPRSGMNRGVSILDFILRLIAIMATLVSAIAMGTTSETLPFITRFIRFRARYNDLSTFTFFVISNSIVCAYLVVSLAISIFRIMRSAAQGTRAMLALLTAGASAAAAIVYLAHKGNTCANWFSICQQFNSFCEHISGSLIGSFGAILLFILLILLSSLALSRH